MMQPKQDTAATRIALIKEVLGGGSVSDISRKYGVSRATIYRWKKKALQAIQSSLKPNNAGRRRKVVRYRAEINRLNRRLEKKGNQVEALKQQLKKIKRYDPRPPSCPECGCLKLYKNGTNHVPMKNLMPPEKCFSDEKIPVQRYLCPACAKSTYLNYPVVFYHWVLEKDLKS